MSENAKAAYEARVHEVGAALAEHSPVTGASALRCICGWRSVDLTHERPYYDWTGYHEHVARSLMRMFAPTDNGDEVSS